MPAPVEVEFLGLESLRRRLQDPSLMADPTQRFLHEAAEIAQRTAVEGVDAGTGIAVRSINAEIKPLEARVFSAMPRRRLLSIERGRPPGEFPPLKSLERWAKAVGITENVFKIAEGIRQRGVKGRFFMQAAREKTFAELPRLVKRMAEVVERRWRR